METTKNYTYDVFISYSRSDYDKKDPNNLIVNILKLFDQNRVKYFFDQSEVVAGDEYASIITNAIIESETFLFISTENANSSVWTSKEIALANHYKKKIIPIRADESFYNSSIVFYLADIDYIDGSNTDKVLERLAKSVVAPIKEKLEKLEQEEKRKQEEEKKKREEEQRKEEEKKREQESLISSIKLDIAQLESDEKTLNITKEKIKLQIEKVESKETRDELSSMLSASKPEEDKSLQNKIVDLENELKSKEDELKSKVVAIEKIKQDLIEKENALTKSERYIRDKEIIMAKEHDAFHNRLHMYERDLEALRLELERYKQQPGPKPQPKPGPKPRPASEQSNFITACRQRSKVTNALFFISALALIIAPMYFFAETGAFAFEWGIALMACSFIAATVLSLMFCKRRISIIFPIIIIVAYAVLTFYESDYALLHAEEWPTTFGEEESQKYIPIPLMMAAVYILGTLPLLRKEKKA